MLEITILIATLLLTILGGIFFRRATAINRALADSIKQQSIEPVMAQIHSAAEINRPNLFHRAISHLWRTYERSLAASLIRIFLTEHREVPMAHFWVQEIMSIEPSLGRLTLREEMLAETYRPELAAQCGATG
tara:strand:- start:146 stop:544 length:399 start_codon:yes stop_codon:yes gene_type:complete